jgi:uncharacterized protein (DUF2147 family)
MKTLYLASALALLGGSAAHTETILDAFIGSDARVKIEDCGADTCGTITLGKQKFVVKKSDISSALKDLDIGDILSSAKPPAKERGKSPATADRPKLTEAPTADRSNRDQAVDRTVERPSPTTTAKDAIKQNVAATTPAPAHIVSDATSPIGEWIPKGGEGRVQIRACGQALCGYASGANPNDTDRHNPDASKRNRSSALNRTTYFLTAISFPTTNHLHRCLAATEIQKLPSFSMTGATSPTSPTEGVG